MSLPPDHPLRAELNDEVHARPADVLAAPLRLSYLALFSDAQSRDREWDQLCNLARRHGVTPPAKPLNHFSAELGPFRLRWERHTEFVRYTFIVDGAGEDPFDPPALAAVPQDWLATLSGQTVVAVHAALVPARDERLDVEQLSATHFAGNVLVGSGIGDGAAVALTDFRVRGDGFSRLLVIDQGLTPRQAGRMVQALLELDTYRMMALLALPVARELAPFLSRAELELKNVTAVLANSRSDDEPALLDRLTRLEAEIESRESDNLYRFGAAAAYYELVQRRLSELRELRLGALPTLLEFVERRLAPAMNTCRATAARQESLSARVARANELLLTRVDITREMQNQKLLESMDRRAEAQLRLQQTVEGLSVAAITYYVLGLVGYAAKAAHAAGLPLEPDVAVGIAIPIVGLTVWRTLRRLRRLVTRAKH